MGVTGYSLYKYGLYVNQIVANIKGIDKSKVVRLYENLPIKSRKEIDITSEEIEKILDRKPGPLFREIYNDLEKEIINNKLKNNKGDITEYLLNNYK
jgi:tRNA nucleotidyltransferase (CCA-adding enzyme)